MKLAALITTKRKLIIDAVGIGIIASLFGLFVFPAIQSDASKTYNETYSWLVKARKEAGDAATAWLFKNGDERIDDLIHALPDPDVRITADTHIRYLGNPRGMAALFRWYRERTGFEGYPGIVPVPLTAWDYDRIDSFLTRPAERWGYVPDGLGYVNDYIYPLAIDNSTEAKERLDIILKKTSNLKKDGSQLLNYINSVRKFNRQIRIQDRPDLSESIMKAAFFLNEHEKKYSSAKVLSRTTGGDKILIEVFTDFGALSTKTYHVVLIRDGRFWRFMSVTLVELS